MRDIFTVRVILISLVVLGMAVLLPGLLRLFHGKHHRWILHLVFMVYLTGNLYFTILFREEMPEAMYELELFGAFRRSIRLDFGILGTIRRLLTEGLPAGIRIVSTESLEGQILNILLYVPMGYLLRFVWPKLRFAQVILIGFLASLLTETVQLFFRLGWFDVDDLVNNTLGTIIGAALYLLLIRKSRRAIPD